MFVWYHSTNVFIVLMNSKVRAEVSSYGVVKCFQGLWFPKFKRRGQHNLSLLL